MYRLSSIIVFLLGCMQLVAQSPHGENLAINCAKCHDASGWSIDHNTITFDHNTTDYNLEGAHAQTDCKQCHETLVFNEAPSDCVSCHSDVHNMSVGNDCARCHSSQTWLVDNIPELHEENGFPLIGAHSNLSCVDCHTSETNVRFDRIGNECISCHQDDFTSAQSPNHETANFSTNCIECHDPLGIGWDTEIVNHDFFPLTLGHNIEDCSQCHTTGNFSDADPNCVTCHQDDYAGTQNPNHQSSGFSTNCVACHTTNPGWSPADFGNHDFFPLTLGHDIQDCNECHTTGNFSDADPNCVTCHQDDYAGTQNPDHQSTGFSTNCVACHTTNPGWSPADYGNHDFFPLTLGHDIQDCNECHTTGNFSDADPNCVTCHQDDYAGTQNPNHQSSGFSTDCMNCHTTNPGWTPANINHDFFPLTLGHDIQDCNECHTTSNFSDADPNCVTCHQNDYNNTQNPNHVSSGFPTDCVICHTTNPGWTPATVNHDFFPLTLGHDIQDCNQCHTTGNFADADPNCVTCHQNDYNGSTNPNHQSLNLSIDCVVCHTTNPNWMPASFDNHNDFYQLNGAHATIAGDCAACHNGDYNNTPNTCVGCHQSEYDNTNNPNHQAAQFPTDCMQCHNENAWVPADFDHDGQYFPIYSGKHQGEWNDCVDCHNDPNNYAIFNCLNCHEHNDQNKVDNDHDHPGDPEFAGYVYESSACFQCHPNP